MKFKFKPAKLSHTYVWQDEVWKEYEIEKIEITEEIKLIKYNWKNHVQECWW